jgi:hypothetical protein
VSWAASKYKHNIQKRLIFALMGLEQCITIIFRMKERLCAHQILAKPQALFHESASAIRTVWFWMAEI